MTGSSSSRTTSGPPAGREITTPIAPLEPSWKRRGRALLFWLVVLQMVGVVVFIGGLCLAEDTRPTFILLYAPRQPLLLAAGVALLAVPFTRRRVKLLGGLQLALCLVVLFPVLGLHLGWSRAPKGKVIRVASYNVYFGKMNRPVLMDELAEIVRNVDVLLIQAPHESMPEKLRQRFSDRNVEHYEDFVIITRYKIRELSKPKAISEDVRAMYASYVLETEDGPLGVFNVHPFSPRHALFTDEMNDNIANRERQIEGAVEAAKADGGPFVVIGDTNLPPFSAIGRRHFAGLTDAFEDVGFGFGYTFPAKRRWLRLDRAFGSEGIRFLDFRIGPLGESDHRPIFVDFELTKPR